MRTKLLFPLQKTQINFLSAIFLTSCLLKASTNQRPNKYLLLTNQKMLNLKSAVFTIHTFNRFKIKFCIANVVIMQISTASLISSRLLNCKSIRYTNTGKRTFYMFIFVKICSEDYRSRLCEDTDWRFRMLCLCWVKL